MKTNNLTIIPPEGMEVYQEGSEIKFRPIEKKLTYDKIVVELFKNKTAWRLCSEQINEYVATPNWHFNNNCTSEKQARKLGAINKLMNVAKYLNGDWQPNWRNSDEYKYCLIIETNNITIGCKTESNNNIVYFKTSELAQQAIRILGEETIKLALCTDW